MSQRAGRWLARAALGLYPLIVMAPVLAPGTRHHVRNRFADPQLLTDFDGGIRLAYLLRAVTLPWSLSPLSGYPHGESLLRAQAVSQGIQLAAMHLLTRFFQPVFSMNLIVLVGWITTGVAVYGLARRLGLERWWAVTAGVLAQVLPSLPTMAANFTSYVYIGVPVFVVSRAIDMSSAPSRRNLAWMCAALGATLFFDPYWFFFALAGCIVALVVNVGIVVAWLRTEPQWMRLVAIALCLMPLLLVSAMLSIGTSSSPGSSSRPIVVETARFVNSGLRSPADWFRSDAEGLGVVLGIVCLVSLVAVCIRRRDPCITAAGAVAGLMVLLSTRTRIELPWFTIGSAAEYARFVMPGVRFFQRSALVAEAILCVFAVLGVQALWRARRGAGAGAGAVGLVLAMCAVSIVELAPYDRAISRRWDDFAVIRDVLAESPTPVVLALPFERHGRGWLELSMLEDVHAVNQLYSRTREDLTTIAASQGPERFAEYLASLGVTHVLAMTGDARFPLEYEFTSPYFELRTTLMLDGYGDPDEQVGLYELRAGGAAQGADEDADETCMPTCVMGDAFQAIRSSFVLDDPGPEDDVIDARGGWWATGTVLRMQVPLVSLPTITYTAVGSITVSNVPCGTSRSVHLEFGEQTHDVVLEGNDQVRMVFPMSSAATDEVLRIEVDGPPCAEGPGGREVTLDVSSPVQESADEPLGVSAGQ